MPQSAQRIHALRVLRWVRISATSSRVETLQDGADSRTKINQLNSKIFRLYILYHIKTSTRNGAKCLTLDEKYAIIISPTNKIRGGGLDCFYVAKSIITLEKRLKH